MNITLHIGSAAEEVTVRAEAPLVETAQGRVSGLIEQTQVENLPLMGRNFFSLVVLTPGVIGRATGGGQAYAQSNADLYNNEFGVNMNANGARTESNNFLVDSSTVSSSQRSGVVNINPNSESVQEVRVAVNNFSAEYGRNGSVLVNVITKSGIERAQRQPGHLLHEQHDAGEELLPEAGDRLQPSRLRAHRVLVGRRRSDQAQPDVLLHVGRRLRSDVAVSGARTILTPEFIRFMEQARPTTCRPTSRRTFRRRLPPTATSERRGSIWVRRVRAPAHRLADRPVPCNLPVTGEGTWNETSPRNGFQWTARIDHTIREGKDRIYGSFNRTTTDKVGFGTPEVYPGSRRSPTSSMQFNTNWTRILSPTTVNETSFSWVRPWGELSTRIPTSPASRSPASSATRSVGTERVRPEQFRMARRAHDDEGRAHPQGGGRLHAGARRQRSVARVQPADLRASTACSISPRIGRPPEPDRHRSAHGRADLHIIRFHRTQSVSAFVQNDWKVKAESLAQRWAALRGFPEHLRCRGRHGQHPVRAGGDLQTHLATAQMVERKYYLEGGLWSGGMHTFAPRASFAWDPTHKGTMSIRGGIGRSYERMSNQIWDGEYHEPAGVRHAHLHHLRSGDARLRPRTQRSRALRLSDDPPG